MTRPLRLTLSGLMLSLLTACDYIFPLSPIRRADVWDGGFVDLQELEILREIHDDAEIITAGYLWVGQEREPPFNRNESRDFYIFSTREAFATRNYFATTSLFISTDEVDLSECHGHHVEVWGVFDWSEISSHTHDTRIHSLKAIRESPLVPSVFEPMVLDEEAYSSEMGRRRDLTASAVAFDFADPEYMPEGGRNCVKGTITVIDEDKRVDIR